MSFKSLLLGYLDFIFKNAYIIYNLLHNICICLNKTNLSLPISGQALLTNPHLPTQCLQPTWDMPWGQDKPHKVPEGEPSTFQSQADKRLHGGVLHEDPSLASLPQLPPILWLSLSPAPWRKWGDTSRKDSAGKKQWNTKFLKKNTGAGQYISINYKHKRLTIKMKHLLPS